MRVFSKKHSASTSIMLAVLGQVGVMSLHGQALPESPKPQALLVAPRNPASPISVGEPAVIAGSIPSSNAQGMYGSFTGPSDPDDDDFARLRYKASSYVPVDSWVYAALDRLEALGYLQTSSAVIRPMTRLECARLIEEANILYRNADAAEGNDNAESLLNSLEEEFAHELRIANGRADNRGAVVDSVYTRYTGISGTPLRDSFHFSQSIADDFGRPYGHGSNVIAGFSGHAERGSFALYVRGEYQRGGANAAYSQSAQETIVDFDRYFEGWSTAPGAPVPGVFNYNPASASRPRFIEAYVAVNVANWQISAGQQSLWWGPDRSTSLILSNNAAAMPMIRIARTSPAHLPGFLGGLGPLHVDAFFARQGGIHYVGLGSQFVINGSESAATRPPPYLWGLTLSIKPTPNLEIGFAHNTIFAGYGRPLTLGTFFHTFSNDGNGQAVDPGKRVTDFNFAYHLPLLRRQVLVYSEAMAWDNPIQGHFTARYALDPGIYFAQLPFVKKLDLRVEGVYTDLPGIPETGYFYSNAHYPQGYTNYGQVMGSWVGRQGRGGAGTTTYWFSSRTKAAITYRRMVANPFLLRGGNTTDVSASFTWKITPRLEVSTVQGFDRWHFQLLNAAAQSSYISTFQVQLLGKPSRY